MEKGPWTASSRRCGSTWLKTIRTTSAIIAGIMAEVVRIVFSQVLPHLRLLAVQGPFSITVSFLLLFYFETFVVLGGAFLASQSERYPWMGFLKTKRSDSSSTPIS